MTKNTHLTLRLDAKEAYIRSIEEINSGHENELYLHKLLISSEVIKVEAQMTKERDTTNEEVDVK
jgi:hypothetical protein